MLTKRNLLRGSTALAGCLTVPGLAWACGAGGYGNSLTASTQFAVGPNLPQNTERNRPESGSGLGLVTQLVLGMGSVYIGSVVGGVIVKAGATIVVGTLIAVGVAGVVYFLGIALTNLNKSGPIFESASIEDGGYVVG
jgi:hypothetical protein